MKKIIDIKNRIVVSRGKRGVGAGGIGHDY